MANPKQVYLPEKNITLQFPENAPDDAIRQIIKRDWDKLPDKRPDIGTWIGEKLAGGYETAVSPQWSAKETVKKAIGGAVEALGYGTPQGMAVTFGLPFAAQAVSGLAAIPAGIVSAAIEPSKEKGGRDRLEAGLETATKVIEGSKELVSKIPIIGTPISPVGETVQKAFSFVPEVVEKGIELGQKATGGYKEESAEPLRKAASELASYSLYGILGTYSPSLRNAIINKYFPNKKPVLNLPNETYQQKYTDFKDFITKNDLDISTPETRTFAVKAYNDILTVQKAMAKEAAKQAKRAMQDPELKQAAEAVKNNRMTLQDWRDLQEFKKREYVYNMFEEAVKRGDIAKEEADAIRQELIEQGGKPPLTPSKEPVKKPTETPKERKARLEQERLQAIREELTRQADEARDKQIKQERMKQLEEIDRLIKKKYGETEPPTATATGKSIEYRFSPDTRAGEFYDVLINTGFTKARAEQIVNTVYPEAPKIEVARGYRTREEAAKPGTEVKEPQQPPVEVKQPVVEKPAEVKPTGISPELEPLTKEARKYDWKLLEAKGKLFDGEGKLTPEGRIAYLRGIIEKNPLDIKEIKQITGELPFPKDGMQGMTKEEWQKALSIADNVYIEDVSKSYTGMSGVKITPKVFEGKFSDFYNQATAKSQPKPEPTPEPKQAQPVEEPVSATEQVKETKPPKPEPKPEPAYSSATIEPPPEPEPKPFPEPSIKAQSDKELIEKLEKYRDEAKPESHYKDTDTQPEPLTVSTPTSTFTIKTPTKETLSTFIKKLKSAVTEETKGKTKETTQELMSRKSLDSDGISFCNAYTVRKSSVSPSSAEKIQLTKDGFVVFDGVLAVKPDARLEKTVKELSSKGRGKPHVFELDKTVSDLLTPNPEPASIIAEVKAQDTQQSALVSDLKTPPKELLFNPHYIDYILRMYPKAETYLHGKGDYNILEFRDKGKTVGALTQLLSPEELADINTTFSSRLQELRQLQSLKEPSDRNRYVDSLSKTSSPTIEDVQKAEVKQTGKKSKLRDFTDIINNERGELILGYRSVENVLQDLGVTFKKLPEPLEFFKGIKGDIRKKIMLNDTIARIFPHVREHMDILDQIERLPNKYKFEEYKSLQPFFTLKNPEKVYQFIEQLRKEGKKRSEYPLTDELLNSKGFTEAEKNAIKAFTDATHRYMDFYIRRTLLNHARLDGDYTKPMNYTEAKELVRYLEENNADPHIIQQAKAIERIHGQVDTHADQYYFPASRYGKYYILAKTPDGEKAYLAHVDNKKDMPEIVKKLKQEHPEWEISAGENYKPKTELAYELPPHILSVVKAAIEDLDKSGALTVTGKDLLTELQRMSAKWKGSFGVHLLEADLIPGWEKNFKKSTADYVHKMVKNYVYSEYIPEFRKALAKLDVRNDAPLIEILKQTLDDVTSAQYKFAPLSKFMFFYYLSGNFKSALINLTQPVAITFPWATKHVSTKEATAMFHKAYADAINYRLKRHGKLNPELKSLMDELAEREILIAQGIKEMIGHVEDVRGLKTVSQTGLEYLSLPFKEAEMLNRYHAASMFYQIGKKKGLSGEELMKFVEREGINMTQFDYSTVGLPQIARGALRPMFIFRVFAINWLSRARQLLREHEYKSFATLLGTHFLLGGIAGVPMTMEFLKAIHWAYNKLADRDEAFEVDMRALGKQISEEYGDKLADYIQYGLPAVAGATISGSVNPVDLGTLDTQHPVYGLIRTVTGVAPDIAVRAQRAYNIWKRHSNAYRTVETMMPEFVRNILVAYRWYDEKGATMPNGELIFTPNLFQIALKGLGFNSTEYINMLSKREVIRNLLEEHKIKTTNINERLGLALAKGDMKTFTSVLDAVITQNIKNIEHGRPVINIDQNAIKQHMLKILNPEAYRRVPKTLQPTVREIEDVYGRGEEEED